MASPNATPLVAPGGWYDELLMYSCLFVGFMKVFTCTVSVHRDIQEGDFIPTVFVGELYRPILAVHVLDELCQLGLVTV